MAETLRKILDIQLNYNDAVKRMAELRQALEEVEKAETKLASARKTMSADEYNRNVSILAESTKHYRQELNTLSKEVQKEITDKTAQVGSIKQLVAALEKLKSEYSALSATERAGTKGTTMLADMKNLATQIKEATAPLKNFSTTATASADSIEGMKAKIRTLTQEFERMTKAERETTGKTKLGEISRLTREVEKETRAMKESNKTFGGYNDSVNGLRQRLRSLTLQFDELSRAERNGANGKDLVRQIKQITEELKKAEQSTGRFSRNVGNYTQSMVKGFKQMFIQVGLGFTTIGQFFVGVGNAIKSAIDTATQFNREVSKLAAILQTTADGVSALTAQAKQLGATTRYTAGEVVQLQTELAKLGYQQSQIINMSESVLAFAQATGTDLASAAGVAGAALRIFGADSTQTAKYVDMMSVATAKSALNFEYIKTALPIVGGAADMFGFSLQDTLTLLGQLANSGMEASMAATATRNIFLKLADSNGKLAQALGKPVKNLDDLLNGLAELRARGADLNDALELTNVRAAVSFTRFLNTTDAARKLSEQLNWSGINAEELSVKADKAGMTVDEFKAAIDKCSKGQVSMDETSKRLGITIDELKKLMNDCTGAAKEMANTMEENLGGDITRLKSAWDDFMLSLEKGQGPLRAVVQWLLSIVNALGLIARSVEESMNIAKDTATQNYIQSEGFKNLTDSDMITYENKKNKYIKEGKTTAEAMALAQEAVLKQIDNYTNILREEEEAARKEREAVEKENAALAKKNNEEIQIYLQQRKELLKQVEKSGGVIDTTTSLGTGTRVTSKQLEKEIALYEKYIEVRQKEADAAARVNAQTTRAEVFSTAANKNDPTGLGMENDKEIRARVEGQKQAMKKLIDALKAYNKSVLAITKSGDNAVLKELAERNDVMLTQDMAAAEKQIAELEKKYQEEINAMRYKIEVDLVPRPKATPQEIAQMQEAVEIYEKAIENKQKELETEKNRIVWRLAIEQAERMNTLRKAQLENIGFVEKDDVKRIKETYRLRKEVIDDEEQKELNQLEIDASKDVRIENQKEALKLEILNKYRRMRLDLIREENDESNKLVLDTLKTQQAKLVKESDRAKMAEQIAYNELGNILANGRDEANGESQEAYLKRVAEAERKAAEATDARKEAVMRDNLKMLESQREYYRGTTMNLKQERQRREEEYREILERGKLALQSTDEYNNEVKEKLASMKDAQYDFAMHLVDSATNAASAFSTLFSTLSEGIEQNMEDNEEWIKTARKLSLASIYLAQGVAIAEAIKNATKDPSSFTIVTMLANIATAVATIVAATMQAHKAAQQAKFAKGAVNIHGAGTTTSDSIDARISRGESVMTAKATEMFGGLLVIMNKIASQPSVTLPTQYARFNPAQSSADYKGNAEAMKEAVREIRPVVSVREITNVKNRVKAIETLDTF